MITINTLVLDIIYCNIFSIFARVLILIMGTKTLLQLLSVILLIGVTWYQTIRINTLNTKIGFYDNNFKALSIEKDSLKNSIIAYKFNVEQLEMLNDSIIKDLNNTRKELKIKDDQLLQMQSIKTEITTKDSIFIKDTIFKDSFVKLDTSITNKWYNIKVELEYPSTIKVDATYKSDLSVFASSDKEILGTPKKCFLGRLFQKKYNIIRVEVVDANPFSEIKENKFVIIE